MDDPAQKRQMSQDIKSAIKSQTRSRRDAHSSRHQSARFLVTLQADYHGGDGDGADGEPDGQSREPGSLLMGDGQGGVASDPLSTFPASHSDEHARPRMPRQYRTDRSFSESSVGLLGGEEEAWDFECAMIYIDHVFPFLFPFYRPSLGETSRAWLLPFMRMNKTIQHLVKSLSSFFIACGLRAVSSGEEEPFHSDAWEEVEVRLQECLQMLQLEIRVDNDGENVDNTILKKAQLMETIIHVMVFDRFVGTNTTWSVYLDTALDLFKSITDAVVPESTERNDLVSSILDAECFESRQTTPGYEHQLYSPSQTAFAFFMAWLIYIDIISSTSLRRAPMLEMFHSSILGDAKPGKTYPLDLSSFVGCPNWIARILSDIASLAARKKAMEIEGSVDRLDLTLRFVRIFGAIAPGLEAVEANAKESMNRDHTLPWWLQSSHRSAAHNASQSLEITRIWAHALQVYLRVIHTGFDPTNSEIMYHANNAIQGLQRLPDVEILRALAWPICVVGCLAETREDRGNIELIIHRVRDAVPRSPADEAGRIIEEVWRLRELSAIDHSWDVASCLNVLDMPPLLI
ncbi:hypothetical protein N3K66_008929 [Trichothecium roseum]|uniref:Uncharacterized protein n=1 Tax=Trichothecium roseum TaxID=47278 RepID=A0ACC0UTA9_9HYPO|nr:hypothetical protein N3K66_008929 [Trichothecium roseum]